MSLVGITPIAAHHWDASPSRGDPGFLWREAVAHHLPRSKEREWMLAGKRARALEGADAEARRAREADYRRALAETLALDPEASALVAVEQSEAERLGLVVSDQAETFAYLAADEEDRRDAPDWLLLEPLPKGRYRRWSPSIALLIAEAWRTTGTRLVNPLDRSGRLFSVPSCELCKLLTGNKEYMSETCRQGLRRMVAKSVARNAALFAAGTATLVVLATSTTAAVLTGVSAVPLALSFARGVFSATGTHLAQRILGTEDKAEKKKPPMPAIPNADQLTPQQLFVEHLLLVEKRVFRGDTVDEAALRKIVAGIPPQTPPPAVPAPPQRQTPAEQEPLAATHLTPVAAEEEGEPSSIDEPTVDDD